jgi:flagellar biosynthesis component FlhA
MSTELATLIKEQKSNLEAVGTGLVERKGEKVVTALAAMVLAVVTGHPEILVLTPFLQEGVRKAFAATAARKLEKAIAELSAEEEKAKFAAQIAEPIEALLGQALIQMVRVQDRSKEEIIDALGGLREDLADFRQDLKDKLDDDGVHIDLVRVGEHGTGIVLSTGARVSIRIKEMKVSGPGSVGIDTRKR